VLSFPIEDTEYTLTLTDAAGCLTTATALVRVDLRDRLLVAPNAFTPNEDAVNDRFFVFVRGDKKFNLKIFNRWGEKVFESKSKKDYWDGTYKGKQAPSGVYVYHVDVTYLDDETDMIKGSVTLIR